VSDVVNRPEHYRQGGLECIEAIEASMSREEFQGYLKGNIEKYVWRYRYKNGVQDLHKARWYLDRLILALET
jgi:hypothetical protein